MKLRALYESIIQEKTFTTNLDVELIYRIGGFKKFIDEYKLGTFPYKEELILEKPVTFAKFDSSRLKSPQCKQAHAENPVIIWCGLSMKDGHANFYNPIEHTIHFSYEAEVMRVAYDVGKSRKLSPHMQKTVVNAMSEGYMRECIEHELSHWLDDTLHNFHLTKDTRKSVMTQKDFRLHGEKDINTTQIELEGQIHGIKALKDTMSDQEWNKITTEELFSLYPSLTAIYKSLDQTYAEDEVMKWQRNLFSRMAREGLLGRRMTHFFNGDI